jgi:hypothetical protein
MREDAEIQRELAVSNQQERIEPDGSVDGGKEP